MDNVSEGAKALPAKQEKPLISVITPCLNAVNTIRDNIERVLMASNVLERKGWRLEQIFVEGGSTDGTREVISKHMKKYRFCRCISGITGGPYQAMNAGINKSKGFYTHVLNADDMLLDPISYAEFIMNGKNLQAKILMTSIRYFRRPKNKISREWIIRSIPNDTEYWHNKLRKGLHYPHPGFIAATNLYKGEGFDIRFSLSADYKLMQSLLLSHCYNEVLICENPIIAMGEGGASSGINAILHGRKQIREINQELGISAPFWKRIREKLGQIKQGY